MKKILSLILCVVMTLSLGTAVFGDDDIKVYVNGKIVESEIKPVIENGNTLIPVRPVAEAMGAEVTWVPEENGVKIVTPNIILRMVLDSDMLYVSRNMDNVSLTIVTDNSSVNMLDVAPKKINGSVYIPMRPMVEALGGTVSWDGETKTITITYDSESASNSYTSDDNYGKIVIDSSIFGMGMEYVGELSNGKANGYGKAEYENGVVYEGQWVNNGMEGQGTMTYANGDVFTGLWEDGGDVNGTMTYANGDVYTGEGKVVNLNVYRWGNGKMVYANGDVYEGHWTYDKRYGEGTMNYANGDVYTGEWGYMPDVNYARFALMTEERHGQGKMTYADGTVQEGTWLHDVFVG